MPHPLCMTPEAAESAFYRAIEAADLEAMMAVWEDSNTILCLHPMGPPLRGVTSIRTRWQQIFASGVRLRFQVSRINTVMQGRLAIHCVYEHITVLGAAQQPSQPVVATNIYHRNPQGWRMILHHGSPAPPVGSPSRPSRRMH